MKIVGCMLVRNEEWIIGASLPAALKWCDEVCVLCHDCTDRTVEIVGEIALLNPGRVKMLFEGPSEHWAEMDLRDRLLRTAREIMSATHFGLIDADEIPTANVIPRLRGFCERLTPGQVLELPMVPVWGDLDHFRQDRSVWSHGVLSIAINDNADKSLTHKPREDGYHFHNRIPSGAGGRYVPWLEKMPSKEHAGGGAMHLQFANKRRLIAKHVLYRMVERVRWPDRRTVKELNAIYDAALDEREMHLHPVPPEWWAGIAKDQIKLDSHPYQEEQIFELLDKNGVERFAGLDLKGFETRWRSERSARSKTAPAATGM